MLEDELKDFLKTNIKEEKLPSKQLKILIKLGKRLGRWDFGMQSQINSTELSTSLHRFKKNIGYYQLVAEWKGAISPRVDKRGKDKYAFKLLDTRTKKEIASISGFRAKGFYNHLKAKLGISTG